jgi:YidC/Oxa1 family membrane protein insertase
MDKNTVTGFILIGILIFVFGWLNRPSQEEIEQKRLRDSTATAKYAAQQANAAIAQPDDQPQHPDTTTEKPAVRELDQHDQYGQFAEAATGEEQIVALENDLLALKFTTRGGQLLSAQLKEYTAYDTLPLMLFDNNESSFGLTLSTLNKRVVNTEKLYFEALPSTDSLSLTMRLHAGEGKYLDFTYTLEPNDYLLDFQIIAHGMDSVLLANTTFVPFEWTQKVRRQELGRKFEEQRTQLYYKYSAENVDYLSESREDSKEILNRLKWIGYKDQYFSTVLIAGQNFESSVLESKISKLDRYTKEFKTTAEVAFDIKGLQPTSFTCYLGPNKYKLLKNYDRKFAGEDMQLEKLVPLGMSLFRFLNRVIIIPVFDFLTSACGSLGIAIFLLTLLIKLALFPLTYKSLLSAAKMRVLRPQIEEINEKYPGQENMMTRQQKTMELYRRVGASPMSGCLPMLLQMPFWIALFLFFPSAIELRHESFLWAKDLSTYDAIISWDAYIPLVTPYFGNHISLFCLLMTITNIIYTKFNMEQSNTGQQQMPGMKLMMYFMPLFMLIFLNEYPAGLNYYYFVSTLITIILTLAFRYFLNEEKLLLKLEENKKKPVKKSGFMARLEEAQKKQQAAMRQQSKERAKNNRRR